jgi:phosphate transport system substrate-binding protein
MTPPRSIAWLRGFAILWIGLLAGFAAGIEWIRTRPEPPSPSGGIDLVGAGATFPYPLYRRWFADYAAATGFRINYLSVGSGEGIRLLLDREVDFGATDRPLTAAERSRATCGPLVIPMAVGPIAVVANLPRVASIRLDAETLAGIFLGRVTAWDSEEVRRLNGGLPLRAVTIRVAHRVHTSGTSTVFESYLRTAPSWRTARPAAAAPWAVGEGFEGNEGVAAYVRATPGAIGFVELSYALQSRLLIAAIGNRAGAFVLPDSASVAATVAELLRPDLPDSLADLNSARGAGAYPIVAVTRIVADRILEDERRARVLLDLARWALREGAPAARSLGYSPLPDATAAQVTRRLDQLTPGRCPALPRAA